MVQPSLNGHSARRSDASRWGAAAKYDFDNPSKWVTQQSVPLLDEHEMSNEKGEPVATVDRYALQEIARNNNKRVFETGDPATIILGHTSDDPRAAEKPAKGFAVNYKVKPFKRDEAGRLVYAIHADLKARPKHAHVLEDYPRRSVELWWHKKELDPIALLGGTTPERDLGVVIRKCRLDHIAMLGGTAPERSLGMTIKYDRKHRPNTVIRYEMMEDCNMAARPKTYEAAPENDDDDIGAESDPVVAKVLQSKAFRTMQSDLQEIKDALLGPGGEGGGEPGMGGAPGGGMGGEMPPEDDGMGGGEPGMGGSGGARPEEEERFMHGEHPVQFEDEEEPEDEEEMPVRNAAGGGYPGPMNTRIPSERGNRYSRNGKPQQSPQVVRLERRLKLVEGLNKQSVMKLARKEAEELVASLENNDGITFGDTPQQAAESRAQHVEMLSLMDDQSREWQVKMWRKHYRRKPHDPASPRMVGAAQYARVADGAVSDEYEPSTPAEAMELAELQTGPKRMSAEEATKQMAKKYGRGRRS